MNTHDRRSIRASASQALSANPGNPRQVVLVYVAVMAVSALLVSALTTVLDNRIAQTGGLADMGLRSILSTIRAVLPLAQTIALWGLHLGYQKAAVSMARCREVQPRDLMDGFAHFGPLVRSMLLQGGLYFMLAMGASYAASFIYFLSPLSNTFIALIQPLVTDADALYTALYTDPEFQAQALQTMLPLIPIWGVIFLAVASPFFYQYRMTNYCILEARGKGALAAMGESARMMKHHRMGLLKLDLSFWWFYLAQAVSIVVLYGDVLLPLAGITLPWSATVSFYVFYVASLLLEGVVYYFFLNRVETTYAAAYDTLRPKPVENQGGAVLGNIFDLAKDYQE